MARHGPKTPAEYRAEKVAIPGQREPAPEDLDPAAAALWDAVTTRLPPDYFTTENLPLLKAYCRHATYADEMAQEIKATRATIFALMKANTKAGNRKLPQLREFLRDLYRMQGAETDHMIKCATKLRLTNQSRWQRDTASVRSRTSVANGPPPWQDWGRALSS